jgi:hypothetical protein
VRSKAKTELSRTILAWGRGEKEEAEMAGQREAARRHLGVTVGGRGH